MNASVVFLQAVDGTWSVYDHGPALVMFAKYRVGVASGLLFMIEFGADGRPTCGRARAA